MTRGTAIVWLSVDDVQRSLSFYRDTLGLDETHRSESWAELDADGLRIGLNATRAPGDRGAVIALHPRAGLDEAVEQLRGNGVEITAEISEQPWGRVATLKDPDGNRLQLCEPLTASRSGLASHEPSRPIAYEPGSNSLIWPAANERRTMAKNLNSFLRRTD